MEIPMKSMLSLTAATACILALASADASAFNRKSTSTGPNGNSRSVESSGGCSGGTCTYSRSVTGPLGRTRTRSRSVSGSSGESGASWERSGTATGPNGNTVTYGGSGSCSGGTCTYERGRTGPNGSVSRSGTVTRY
jgi:hypothetical protein